MNYKLLKIKKITGKIKILTGLHIGAGSDKIEIGGMDNPILKDPVTGAPYIPGSSLKGKMRSLMEWKLNKVLENNGNPCKCGVCDICTVFGAPAVEKGKQDSIEKAIKRGPTRIILRDAHLTKEYQEKFNKGEILIEEKCENSLNRITAAATPRQLERVVPGVEFDFSLVFKVLEKNNTPQENTTKSDEELFNEIVLPALAMLEQDYLGGGGSRGNGKVQFRGLTDEEGNAIQLPKV
ncbi:MAG: RAMP superfamily protein [Candidatus Methanofastidiosum methylothiophilum]|uniref:CRISPR system Cms endoribonuclease Csm3 n=1 Tax=Candidatus Methanofastidiosum methylothiophilum TaxID=1705564 RepID=A0A150ITV1_9EURY|nr:MAG: RAMP superfamily protein [Candidatus Methanofastidiosum methylthiophilus]